MKKLQWNTPKTFVMVAALVLALVTVLAGCAVQDQVKKVPAGEEYVYVNPDVTKATVDAGMKIDGVFDEAVYSEKKWLHLSNDDGGNHVTIAMTTHFGEEGMYFAFDVTESVPIYVNPDRSPTLNSCIELYVAPPHVKGAQENTMFEIDLLPTGQVAFKKSDGKYGYINVTSTNDIMAYLGATTKGGEVNTPECYGYNLELFIPWDYMEWLGQDVEAMKNGYILVNPAHITSNNYYGTNTNLDRYWYHYAQKIGTGFTNVAQYFRFDGTGVLGATEIALEEGAHYSFKGNGVAFPGMQVPITIVPDEGYALTSILLDGQEQINKVVFNEDGSVTLNVRCAGEGQKISAVAEAITSGKKTLSGKLHLNGTMEGIIVSYVGPLGEKPVNVDAQGNFQLTDLEQGYYVLRVEKDGQLVTTHGVYVNRDVYVDLTVKTSVFTVTGGTSWILDDENYGVLHKMGGSGDILSKDSYHDFTLETYIKYDPELATQGTGDYYTQQRSGVRILFSNGKYWHINILRENDRYIMQFAKITGDNSIYSWKNVHTLTAEQIAQYSSAEGIKLTVKRVGNKAAVYLNDKVLFVEELAEEYKTLTAQIGFEAWIANSKMMTIPFSITPSATLPEAPKVYFYASNTWDVTNQQNGVVKKTGVKGVDTWLDAAVVGNDITTIARDFTPGANDYSMIYIITFSNGEQFRVRLNHTDNDGKYRIQSVEKSTLFAAWKNHYTLTEAQAQKVQGEGIAFRVWISGTTAYVYLDGQQVCTYDLSTVVATGKPSGIDKATATVHLRIDGNYGKTFEVPFVLTQTAGTPVPETPNGSETPVVPETPIDPSKQVALNIGTIANGTITPGKTAYAVGETVTLTIKPDAGYSQKLTINGQPVLLDWKTNTYSFVATEKSYTIGGSFEKSLNATPSDANRWDVSNQAHGILTTYYPNNGDSWWININGEYKAITIKAKNYLPKEDTEDHGSTRAGYQQILRIGLDNGQYYAFRLYNDKGTYAVSATAVSGSVTGWGNWKALDATAAAAVNGEGVDFKLERTGGNTLQISVDGVVLVTYTMDGVTEANKVTSVGLQQNCNQGQEVDIPFQLEKAN